MCWVGGKTERQVSKNSMRIPSLTISIPYKWFDKTYQFFAQTAGFWIVILSVILSVGAYYYFQSVNLTLAYNDARSHLNIGRRVVEGLKPGMAQLGSVWLPLPHILMVPTIWNDYMWQTGLAGAVQSMISYVATILLIRLILKKIGVDTLGQVVGMLVFALNLNILYLQSTAMTELLLIGTMTAGVYELINYYHDQTILSLIKASFWIMLSTLIRYDGWFLCFYGLSLVVIQAILQKKWRKSEGIFFLYCTLAGFGVFLWLMWNTAIFKDPLYFAFGPYSAHAQQEQIEAAGQLITKHDWLTSLKTYWYAMAFNSGTLVVILGLLAAAGLYLDKKLAFRTRLALTVLLVPLFFNILALYLGHSVLFVQGINGDTWFNVRYGIMMMPSLAVFVGYLVYRLKSLRYLLIGVLCALYLFQFTSFDAVTIDDGRVGSSQKNVSEVSGWLRAHAADEKGFVLISAASHDAIIFSTGMPMKRFIHEGTGKYWESATTTPDRWARWIVMRTNDNNDQTFKLVNQSGVLYKYQLVNSFPFADIYQLKDEYLPSLQTESVLGPQR